MSNKLRTPSKDLDSDRYGVRVVGICGCEIVGICGPPNNHGEEDGAGDRFKEHVETSIEDCSDASGIKGIVRNREP